MKLFQESVRFATAAVARDPKRDEWQLALSNAHFWLGDALRQQGDHAGALRHFRHYLDISRTLAAAHPGDLKFEAEVSYGHVNVGAAYEAAGNRKVRSPSIRLPSISTGAGCNGSRKTKSGGRTWPTP